MARRVKSLSHNIKQIGNPYESPKPLAKSTYHRDHRAKKNMRLKHRYKSFLDFKRKIEKEKINELDEEIKLSTTLLSY